MGVLDGLSEPNLITVSNAVYLRIAPVRWEYSMGSPNPISLRARILKMYVVLGWRLSMRISSSAKYDKQPWDKFLRISQCVSPRGTQNLFDYLAYLLINTFFRITFKFAKIGRKVRYFSESYLLPDSQAFAAVPTWSWSSDQRSLTHVIIVVSLINVHESLRIRQKIDSERYRTFPIWTMTSPALNSNIHADNSLLHYNLFLLAAIQRGLY